MKHPNFLFLILVLGIGIHEASSIQFPDLTRRLPERLATPGCAYKGERYEHGDRIPTPQPCLNCTCIRALVVCYLRMCPTEAVAPAGCLAVKELGECCPTYVCGIEDLSWPNNSSDSEVDLRPTFLPTRQTTYEEPTVTKEVSSSAASIVHTTERDTLPLNDYTTLTSVSSVPSTSTTVQNVPTTYKTTEDNPTQTTQHISSSGGTTQADEFTQRFTEETTEEDPNPLHLDVRTTAALDTTTGVDFFTTMTEGDSLVFISSTGEPIVDDFKENGTNVIPRGCMVSGTLYGEGSAMLTSTYCEYCFCIHGKSMCLKPKCHLVIDGCTPYHEDPYSCCPSRFDCSNKTYPTTLSPTTHSETPEDSGGCNRNGSVYFEGEVVPSPTPCQSCYCSNSTIVCEKMNCAPHLDGCHPIIPEGHCCPSSYDCGKASFLAETTVEGAKHATVSSTADPETKQNDNFGDCIVEGKRYFHSEIVPFQKACHICYCISSEVSCEKVVCPASKEGCQPITPEGWCCPTSYICDNETTTSAPETTQPLIHGTNLLSSIKNSGDCIVSTVPFFEGDYVPNDNPCQKCYCRSKRIVCDKTECPPPLDGCVPLRLEGQCCPISYRCDNETLLASTTTEPTSLYLTTLYGSPESSGTCIVDGKTYAENDAVPNDKPCEICFCSNSSVICERVKCTLPVNGCKPNTAENICCPLPFRCANRTSPEPPTTPVSPTTTPTVSGSIKYNGNETTKEKTTTSSTENLTTMPTAYCSIEGKLYVEGHAVPSQKPCQRCRCSNYKVVCEDIECSPLIDGCQPITAEGHCCPIAYRCDYPNALSDGVKGAYPQDHPVELNNSEIDKNNIKTFLEALESNKNMIEHIADSSDYLPYRRLDETSKNSGQDALQPPHGSPKYTTINDGMTTLHQDGENDETLNPESYDTTTDKFASRVDDFASEYLTFDGAATTREEVPGFDTVSLDSAEVETIPLLELFNKLFSRQKVSTPVAFTLEPQRNNSKLPTNILVLDEGDTNSPSTLDVDDITQLKALLDTVNDSTETEYDIKEDTPRFELPALADDTVTKVLYYDEHKSETRHHPSTPEIPNITENEEPNKDLTTSKAAQTNTEQETTTTTTFTTESFNIENSSSPSPFIHTRINSKLPSFNYKDSNNNNNNIHDKIPVIANSEVNVYLPIESRHSDERQKDNVNVGSVYIGAPLSVGGSDVWKNPDVDREITQSGGVIFMNQKPPTVVEEPVSNSEKKKTSRVQDTPNHPSSGQGYRIIPFVAQDAVRHNMGKLNSSFFVHQGSSEGLPEMVSDFCFINRRIYTNGEIIAKPDPCEICKCFYGRELCQAQKCPTPPSDCIPEKVPGFCCPRFTCGKNTSAPEHENKEFKPSVELPISSTKRPIADGRPFTSPSSQQDIKFGIRVRTKPTQSGGLVSREYTLQTKGEFQRPTSRPDIRQTTSRPDIRPITLRSDIRQTTSRSDNRPTTSRPNIIPMTARPDLRPTTQRHDIRPAVENVTTTSTSTTTTTTTTKRPPIILTSNEKGTTAGSFLPDPWGLKVSGCNIYGKFYNINDQVDMLSGPCRHCICTANGPECNDIC